MNAKYLIRDTNTNVVSQSTLCSACHAGLSSKQVKKEIKVTYVGQSDQPCEFCEAI